MYIYVCCILTFNSLLLWLVVDMMHLDVVTKVMCMNVKPVDVVVDVGK